MNKLKPWSIMANTHNPIKIYLTNRKTKNYNIARYIKQYAIVEIPIRGMGSTGGDNKGNLE